MTLPATRVLVVSKHPNPTYSYYLEERLRRCGLPFHVQDLDDDLGGLDPDGMFVVICRYITSRQLRWVEFNRPRLAGVALFIDDDLAAIVSGSDGSWGYKFRLLRLGIKPLYHLRKVLDAVWVSTPELAQRLPSSNQVPLVMPPFPVPFPQQNDHGRNQADSQQMLKLVYHATGIHHREHDFLRPIIARALDEHPTLRFEVIADGKIGAHWSAMNIAEGRLMVRDSLPWPEYLSYTAQSGADIALAPLLESRTNSSRSDTKRIDIARMKAAAIFSRSPVFDRCATEGELHVDNTAEDWLSAIRLLVTDPARREIARKATAASVVKMATVASPDFPLT
ncbi:MULTISPECIES: hypothetical protein [unclassified Ensifer]|uniref:hypothetical protein n=1 Tax=unclassified Ensifer TaxID=2633371 RepID=UPI001FCDC6A0|nr:MULTISPECIES: hypothetical protein [unclassified Ensifer]